MPFYIVFIGSVAFLCALWYVSMVWVKIIRCRALKCEFRILNYGFLITNCGLRIANCELRIANYELRIEKKRDFGLKKLCLVFCDVLRWLCWFACLSFLACLRAFWVLGGMWVWFGVRKCVRIKKLQIENCKLQIADYRLQCEKKSRIYLKYWFKWVGLSSLFTTNYRLKIADCRLKKKACSQICGFAYVYSKKKRETFFKLLIFRWLGSFI